MQQKEVFRRGAPSIDPEVMAELAARYGLKMILLFGSRAGGKHRPDSDLDVGVWIAEKAPGRCTPPGRQDLRKLFAGLAGALKTGNLHLVILNRASPLLLFEAASTGLPVYEAEPGCFAEFCVLAAKKHWDNYPIYKMEDVYLQKIFGGWKNAR